MNSPVSAPATAPSTPPARLLIADDDDELRAILRKVLTREGYEVHTVGDGDAAMRLLDAGAFDFLVSDIQMPGMDGLAVLAGARARHPGLRIVLITAYASILEHNQAVALGAVECLSKPFKIPELLALLERSKPLA